MNLYLSHMSAWLFWIWWSQSNPIPLWVFHSGDCFGRDSLPNHRFSTSSVLRNPATTKEEVRQVLDANEREVRLLLTKAKIGVGKEGVLHVSVPYKPGKRLSTHNIRFHQVCSSLPRRSFLKVAEGLYVASPELVFMQMSAELELGSLCAYGMELVGGYPLDEAHYPDGGAFWVRRPVSSQTQIQAYAEQYAGKGGVERARRAAKYLREKSASPKETEVALLTLLPRMVGGIGAGEAALNVPVELSGEAAVIARQKRVVCDLLFRCGDIAVEYDGAIHGGQLARATDSRRRDALRLSGIDVVTLTDAQLQNPEEFLAIMVAASRRAGKRTPAFSERDRARHRLLRRQIAFYQGEEFVIGGTRRCLRAVK